MEASAQPRARSTWSPVSLFLIATMAVGSVVMWVGVPVGLIYLASRVADSPNPSMGPYLLIIIGLPVGMTIVGKALGAIDRYHGRITGLDDGKPQQAAWMKSMRGERERKRRRSVLDTVMIVSVGVALRARRGLVLRLRRFVAAGRLAGGRHVAVEHRGPARVVGLAGARRALADRLDHRDSSSACCL